MTTTARRLPGDPSALHLEYSLRHPVRDVSHDRTIERWSVIVRHGYEVHDDTRCPEYCDDADCPVYEEYGIEVGRMQFFRIHLYQETNAWRAMEEETHELHLIACALLDQNSGDFRERADKCLEFTGSDLLVMDRVVLDRPWRGLGLGPILAAEAIDRLRPGARAVACMPGISDREAGWEPSQERWDRITARITAGWEKIGFEEFEDGVYLLDPATTAFENALSALRKDFHDACRTWLAAAASETESGCRPGENENRPFPSR
ncbi:hypothetical protein [Embleya sp. NPDC020630]|uniref:hypothetical protein n=1 Tax=Embleya sp. NPDC020630 TaxID=3363979 RepID=UPI0037B04554